MRNLYSPANIVKLFPNSVKPVIRIQKDTSEKIMEVYAQRNENTGETPMGIKKLASMDKNSIFLIFDFDIYMLNKAFHASS